MSTAVLLVCLINSFIFGMALVNWVGGEVEELVKRRDGGF